MNSKVSEGVVKGKQCDGCTKYVASCAVAQHAQVNITAVEYL